jgi:hypothetical protein
VRRTFKFADSRPTIAVVEQISLPMRIALGVVLAFAALWFVALRPKPVSSNVDAPLPAAPAKKATPAKAKAKATAETKAKVHQAAAAPAAAKPKAAAPAKAETAKAAPAKPAPTPAPEAKKLTPSQQVVADVKSGHTVVLLFWDGKNHSSDDRAVRRAVSDVDRHGGKVRVRVAPLDRIGDYEAIVKGAPVQTSPTVLVIDRKAQARLIEGLTVTREIDNAVGRALKVK